MQEGSATSSNALLRYVENTTKNVLSAAAISLFFFVWSDYVDKQPNLNGTWYITGTTTGTSYSKFRGLKVTYQVNLLQDKLHISGFGEKISDELNGEKRNYYGKDRVQIEIAANITHRYLSKDTLELEYTETGTLRRSSTFQKLIRYDDDSMSGTFSSTIANSKGTVEWRRTP